MSANAPKHPFANGLIALKPIVKVIVRQEQRRFRQSTFVTVRPASYYLTSVVRQTLFKTTFQNKAKPREFFLKTEEIKHGFIVLFLLLLLLFPHCDISSPDNEMCPCT